MNRLDRAVPQRFCWTKFGTESGESVENILERKEMERSAHQGMFLWGIGNSVGPAVRELVRREPRPMVLFSPMRSRPKQIDVEPSAVLRWTRAFTLNDEEWRIPPGVQVLSRGATHAGAQKRSHYALVCRSDSPLTADQQLGDLDFGDLVNLLSHSKLGHSQVTSVVQLQPSGGTTGTRYPIGFAAELAFPYFIRLVDPIPVSGSGEGEWREAERAGVPVQQSLVPV